MVKLVRREGSTPIRRLWVSYTPNGATADNIGVYGLQITVS